MLWISTAASDRGRVRPANEDSCLEAPERGLFAVADGMGGHAGGEVASRIAVETLDRLGSGRPTPSEEWMRQAIAEANRAILEQAARSAALRGMGTTLTAVVVGEAGRATIGHVGDSRAYLLRSGRLALLTCDHTVAQRYVDEGRLGPVEARVHPMRHLLTRALGARRRVEADVVKTELEPGDLLLLCSDGLTGMVPDADLEALLSRGEPLPELARRLVEAANLRGGEDNVTVVLVRFMGEAQLSDEEPAGRSAADAA